MPLMHPRPDHRPPTRALRAQLRTRTVLDEHLPVDHKLSRVYRVGAGLTGMVLLAFGILGLIDRIGFFDTRGTPWPGSTPTGR